jgi:hypothetical protein
MLYRPESLGGQPREIVWINGQAIEVLNFVGEGLFEAVSKLHQLEAPMVDETTEIPEAA